MFDCDLHNGDVVEEHDSLVHCVVALVSVSSSESSKIRGMVSFLLIQPSSLKIRAVTSQGDYKTKGQGYIASFSKTVG